MTVRSSVATDADPAVSEQKHHFSRYPIAKNHMHNTVRSLIASSIRQNASYEVYEEVGCVSSDGSTRRADIIIIDRQKDKGVILDPTIRFEMHEQQPQEVCREKQVIYEPCCQHLGAQYHITHWTVSGLMFGARGTIPRETLNQLKHYKISDATIDAIGSHVLKSSLAIISNHLKDKTAQRLAFTERRAEVGGENRMRCNRCACVAEPSPLYDNNHYHEECLRCNSCGLNLTGPNQKRARRFKNQILCDLHFADVALMECSDFMQQLRSFKPQSLGCAVARRKSSTTLIFPLPPQACSESGKRFIIKHEVTIEAHIRLHGNRFAFVYNEGPSQSAALELNRSLELGRVSHPRKVVQSFDLDDAAAIQIRQELLNDRKIEKEVTDIKSNFGYLPDAIIRLVQSGVELVEQINIMRTIANKLSAVEGEVGKRVGEKMNRGLIENDGRLRWAGHVARVGESRNAYRVLVGRPEGKRPLGRPRRRWEDNIKMVLREVGYDDRDWINLAQDRDRWRAYVRAAMNPRVP
ncbi:hypothetical protein ANN_20313 [Periplaneta americana]|uniref:LIM zinc-binding domain-containing protein n=1 Tax=Periplaneta americana TaxID=6978 RepID=A0ABQ8SC99_PERAM|nr:hypothetical protein ANN_20313 [Periplaneta americana]